MWTQEEVFCIMHMYAFQLLFIIIANSASWITIGIFCTIDQTKFRKDPGPFEHYVTNWIVIISHS